MPITNGPHGRRNEWMTLDEIAQELKIPKANIYAWRGKGDFPRSARYGRYVRVLRSDFEDWVEAKMRE